MLCIIEEYKYLVVIKEYLLSFQISQNQMMQWKQLPTGMPARTNGAKQLHHQQAFGC